MTTFMLHHVGVFKASTSTTMVPTSDISFLYSIVGLSWIQIYTELKYQQLLILQLTHLQYLIIHMKIFSS